jgi:hypothetical protein
MKGISPHQQCVGQVQQRQTDSGLDGIYGEGTHFLIHNL